MKDQFHRGILAMLLASAGTVSCTHTQAVKTAAPPSSAPLTVWERQVRNAVDAGDGDYKLKALRDRVAAEPDNIAVRLELSAAYRERGFAEVALEISRLATARFPESGEAQLSLARDLRATGRRAEAVTALETFLRTHGDAGADYWSWLGILRDEMGLWPSGEPAHRKALELSTNADSLHNNLGYNLLMQQKFEAAAEEFREALKLNPRNATARNNLGTALAHNNATAQAVATWQTAADPASAHNNLATVWMEKGNYVEARKELELALGYNRAHPAALRNLALLTRLDGKTPAPVVGSHRSLWAGLKGLFVGPLDNPKEDAVNAASR